MGLTDRAKRVALIGLGVIAVVGLIVWLLWSARQPPPEPKPQTMVPPDRTLRTPLAPPTDGISTFASTPASAPAENAADIYRKAFALYDALPRDNTEAFRVWRGKIDTERSAQLCEKVRPILELMHQAATLTNCDWGIKPATTDTPHTVVIPHITRSLALVRTALWSAGHCEAGNPAGAVADLWASLQLGHNLPPSGQLSFLVEMEIQGMAVHFVALNASRFASPERERLIQVFTDTQFEEGFYRAIEQEVEFANQLAQARGNFEFARQVAEMVSEYERAVMGTEDQYQAWRKQLRIAKESNPPLKMLWPIFENPAQAARAMVVERTMVAAGLTAFQSGPEALSSYPDPATGQPFEYRETADGFVLQSAFQRDGQPVTMEFRR